MVLERVSYLLLRTPTYCKLIQCWPMCLPFKYFDQSEKEYNGGFDNNVKEYKMVTEINKGKWRVESLD